MPLWMLYYLAQIFLFRKNVFTPTDAGGVNEWAVFSLDSLHGLVLLKKLTSPSLAPFCLYHSSNDWSKIYLICLISEQSPEESHVPDFY